MIVEVDYNGEHVATIEGDDYIKYSVSYVGQGQGRVGIIILFLNFEGLSDK